MSLIFFTNCLLETRRPPRCCQPDCLNTFFFLGSPSPLGLSFIKEIKENFSSLLSPRLRVFCLCLAPTPTPRIIKQLIGQFAAQTAPQKTPSHRLPFFFPYCCDFLIGKSRGVVFAPCPFALRVPSPARPAFVPVFVALDPVLLSPPLFPLPSPNFAPSVHCHRSVAKEILSYSTIFCCGFFITPLVFLSKLLYYCSIALI